MLLLAPELRSIAVCFMPAESELDAVNTIDTPIAGKLYGVARASAPA